MASIKLINSPANLIPIASKYETHQKFFAVKISSDIRKLINDIIVYLLAQYELSCNLIRLVPLTSSISEYYLSAVPCYTLKTGNSKIDVKSPKLETKFPFNQACMLSNYFLQSFKHWRTTR